MLDSYSKTYVLDSKKVVCCIGGDLAVEALISSINRVHDLIVNDYPEAKNFLIMFEYDKKDVDVFLAFDRYETDEERIDRMLAEKTSESSNIFKKIIFGVIIVISIAAYYLYSTKYTENQHIEYSTSSQISNSNAVDIYASSHEKQQSKYRDIKFRTVQDVHTYLNGNSFVDDNRKTVLRFSNEGMSVNNRLLYTNVRVVNVCTDGAILKASGPYGISTFAVKLEDHAHYIYDVNDGVTYDGKW